LIYRGFCDARGECFFWYRTKGSKTVVAVVVSFVTVVVACDA